MNQLYKASPINGLNGGRGRTRTCDLLRVKLPLEAYVVDCIRRRNPLKLFQRPLRRLLNMNLNNARFAGVCNELRERGC